MKLSYEQLIQYLKQGREIEFFFSNKKYSFSHNSKGWYLTEYNNPKYQSFNTPEDLINNARIENLSVDKIWANIVIDAIF